MDAGAAKVEEGAAVLGMERSDGVGTPHTHPVKFLDYRSLPQRLSMESLGWSGE